MDLETLCGVRETRHKDDTLHDSVYRKFPEQANPHRKRLVTAMGRETGGKWRATAMATRLLLEVMEMSGSGLR